MAFNKKAIVLLLIVLKVIQTIAFKSPKNCGKNALSEGKVNQFIVGGTEAKTNEFPFMASLQRLDRSFYPTGHHFCGGSILNKRWILTSAHCIDNEDPDRIEVAVGMIDRRQTFRVYKVETMVVHGCFHQSYLGLSVAVDDIALIKTQNDIDLNNRNIGSICLPPKSVRPLGSEVWVTGWGVWNESRSAQDEWSPYILQKMNATVVSEEWCVWHSYFLNDGFFGWREDNRLCLQKSGSSSCRGDFGGPAFQLVNGKAYQLGITAFGGSIILYRVDNTCRKSYPGVWENVAKYVDWISQVIDEYDRPTDSKIRTKCTRD